MNDIVINNSNVWITRKKTLKDKYGKYGILQLEPVYGWIVRVKKIIRLWKRLQFTKQLMVQDLTVKSTANITKA